MHICVMVKRYRVCVSHGAKGSYVCVSWCKRIMVSHGAKGSYMCALCRIICVCLVVQKDCVCVCVLWCKRIIHVYLVMQKDCVCFLVQKDRACVSYGGKTYVCLMVKMNIYLSLIVQN